MIVTTGVMHIWGWVWSRQRPNYYGGSGGHSVLFSRKLSVPLRLLLLYSCHYSLMYCINR